MAITDIPILSMLRTRLQWAQQRQAVLAENVANADTPSYRSRDLAPLKFEAPAQGARAAAHHRRADAHRERPHRRDRAGRLAVPHPKAKAITRCARPAMP